MTRRIVVVSNADAGPALDIPEASVIPCREGALAGAGDAALWVFHLDRARASEQLAAVPGTAPIIAVVPGATLEELVATWQLSDRVAGVSGTEDVAAIAGRVFAETPPALAMLAATTVLDHEDKTRALADVRAAADRLPAQVQDAIEQAADELLMNALYAAPVDAEGRPIFAGVPVKRRVAMRTAERVTLKYGADDKRFVVSVRDAFGALDRATVLRVLHKGLHADDKVDRKTGGAGLGLFLIASSATVVTFDVVPGSACEITCVFETGPRPPPPQLAFVRREPATRTAPARAIRSDASRRRIASTALAAAGTAIAAVVLAVAALGPSYEKLTISAPAGAAIEIDGKPAGTIDDGGALIVRDLAAGSHLVIARLPDHATARAIVRSPAAVELALPPVAKVELDSTPSDALVELGGVVIGATPLTITALAPATRSAITLAKPGYQRATVQLDVPAAGKTARVVQPLVRAPDLVRVRLESDPPGAEIVREGVPRGADRTYTPADVYVKTGEKHRFTLVMPKHAPLAVEVDGTEGAVAGGPLVPSE